LEITISCYKISHTDNPHSVHFITAVARTRWRLHLCTGWSTACVTGWQLQIRFCR